MVRNLVSQAGTDKQKPEVARKASSNGTLMVNL